MDTKELLDFLKYVITVIAIVIVIRMVIDSGFKLNKFKIGSEKFNIEVSGHEKSVQPDQE